MNNKSRSLDIIILPAALVAVFMLALFKIANYDIWWILANGRYIVEHLEIPFRDVFRFVSIEREYHWFNHLYLTGTIFYLIYLAGNFKALILFKAFIVALTFGVFSMTLRTVRKEACCFAAILLLLAAFSVRFRMVLRPDIFSFLFFVAVYYIAFAYKSGKRAPLFLLPIIHLFWVNLHGGYFAGLVLLWTIIAMDGAKLFAFKVFGLDLTGRIGFNEIKRLVIYAAASSVAVLVSPYGIKTLNSFRGFVSAHGGIGTNVGTARVGEWQPLALTHFKGLGICFTSEYGIILLLFFLSTLLVIKKVDITDIVLSVGFIYASTISIRFIPFASFVMVPAIFRNFGSLNDLYNRKSILIGLKGLLLSFALVGVLLGIKGLGVPPSFKFGVGVPAGRYPEDAVRFIQQNNIKGNFFNSYGIGGYLIWRFYPERRVFMDGRVLNNIGDYYSMVDSSEGWRKNEEIYDFDVIVLENDRKDFVHHIYSNPDWSLVFFDDRALVFLKNRNKYMPIIDRYGYKKVRPTFLEFSYLDHFLGSPEKLVAAQKELRRNILSTRHNSEARLAMAYLYFNSGTMYHDAALKQILAAIEVDPDLSMARSALGWFYLQKGKRAEGLKELRKALELDPADPLAIELLSAQGAR